MVTKEHIDKLKESWIKDPCWDLETTEGFEEHTAELLTFRKQKEADWEKAHQERVAKKAHCLGISDLNLAECLYAPEEIEKTLRGLDYSINNAEPNANFVNLEIGRIQVRTLLFVGIQIKRIADALENINGRGSLEESVRIWGSGS